MMEAVRNGAWAKSGGAPTVESIVIPHGKCFYTDWKIPFVKFRIVMDVKVISNSSDYGPIIDSYCHTNNDFMGFLIRFQLKNTNDAIVLWQQNSASGTNRFVNTTITKGEWYHIDASWNTTYINSQRFDRTLPDGKYINQISNNPIVFNGGHNNTIPTFSLHAEYKTIFCYEDNVLVHEYRPTETGFLDTVTGIEHGLYTI